MNQGIMQPKEGPQILIVALPSTWLLMISTLIVLALALMALIRLLVPSSKLVLHILHVLFLSYMYVLFMFFTNLGSPFFMPSFFSFPLNDACNTVLLLNLMSCHLWVKF